jgi:hypothetical protein
VSPVDRALILTAGFIAAYAVGRRKVSYKLMRRITRTGGVHVSQTDIYGFLRSRRGWTKAQYVAEATAVEPRMFA